MENRIIVTACQKHRQNRNFEKKFIMASFDFCVAAPPYGSHSLLAFALVLDHVFRRLLKTHCFDQAFNQFPLAAHPSASDSVFGRHRAL